MIFLYYSIKCVVDEGDIHYVKDVGLILQLLHIQVCIITETSPYKSDPRLSPNI